MRCCKLVIPHTTANVWQFTSGSENATCYSCGTAACEVPCEAVKVWEYEKQRKAGIVYHHGNHRIYQVLS